ncbi:MAG: GNAT family N-acetyltransferase [Nitrospirae bacterium]|nr:GNAT family N-acetyltransferase [Nitrospirota bacterium]
MPEITLLDRIHDRNGFDCGVPALNEFLRTIARQHSSKGISRTFVLTAGTPAMLGFYTLTLCELSVEQLPDDYARKYPLHGLPAVRLARLAVSRKEQGKGYGKLLLADAVHRTSLIAGHAGVIGLFVDAKDDEAGRFYEQFGFLAIPDHPLQLFLPISTVQAACR